MALLCFRKKTVFLPPAFHSAETVHPRETGKAPYFEKNIWPCNAEDRVRLCNAQRFIFIFFQSVSEEKISAIWHRN